MPDSLKLSMGVTYLSNIHDIKEASPFCDHVLVMSKGEIINQADTAQLTNFLILQHLLYWKQCYSHVLIIEQVLI